MCHTHSFSVLRRSLVASTGPVEGEAEGSCIGGGVIFVRLLVIIAN